jgi:hypothetical protein
MTSASLDLDLEMRIMREVALALNGLPAVRPMVAVFGSARAAPESDDYAAARKVAVALGHSGFGVITGGGPGIMEAANRGARESGGLSLRNAIRVLLHQEAGAVEVVMRLPVLPGWIRDGGRVV